MSSAYAVGSVSTLTLNPNPDYYTGNVYLPMQCDIYRPDTTFSRVLLQTTYWGLYEICNDYTPIYFVSDVIRSTKDEAYQLSYFQAEVNGNVWEVPKYKVELQDFFNNHVDSTVSSKARMKIQQSMSRAGYNWKDFARIIKEMNKAKGGKIMYEARRTLAESLPIIGGLLGA